jgi:hypothetical protein
MSSVLNDAVGEAGRSNTSGQRPNENVPHADIVMDVERDIAENALLERITVGVRRRQRFQKIYVPKSGLAGGKTATSYKPADDAPAAGRTLSILPTLAEIEGGPETIEFLVVGVVLAENPGKYSTKASGPSRNKKRDDERVARGVLLAESNILRAIVPITESIGTGTIKYYVACHHLHGLCSMRVIKSEAIFYFEEIWEGIQKNINVKERKKALGAACKKHAARDKRPPQQALIPISATSNSTPSNSISIIPLVNSANADILSDLLSKPSNEGVVRFYDFDAVLKEEDAVKVISAVEVRVELMPILSIASNVPIGCLPYYA